MSANHLVTESSPYLLQHAGNPVEWFPWGEEALALARREGRPILLSIGYSACHWCHVMAHESFEDPATAALMNRLFVNIKVDREERPDLDRIYQTAHQLLAQRPGGWPLTVFLAPDDHAPFFAGTYFPPERRHGMPAFAEVLESVAGAYRDQRREVDAQNRQLLRLLASLDHAPAAGEGDLDETPLGEVLARTAEAYDPVNGGIGGAPKFPHPPLLELLLRRVAAAPQDLEVGRMFDHTLSRMALGGLCDQVGGGFFRYSVDARWEIPHFEKMLYDNGQLLALYAQAWAVRGDPLFRRMAEEGAAWALREMRAPEGGFYATLDADGEGGEGAFYLWSREEARALLDAGEYAALALHYGLDAGPNFEGRWHLHAEHPAPTGQEALLARGRRKLFVARAGRPAPGRDEKLLTAWNGLMIRGLALAGRLLGRPDLLDAAEGAAQSIRDTLWVDGRLLAVRKDGVSRLNAYLDDYAFVLDALLELLQGRWNASLLVWARELADALLLHYEDRERGGFHFTADDHEALIQRPKGWGDEAIPAGNGVAARALLRLGLLLGEPRYLRAAECTLRAGWAPLSRYPEAHCALLHALEEYLTPLDVVVVRDGAERLARWALPFSPARLQFAIPASEVELPGALALKAARAGGVAYLCRGMHCSEPLGDPEALERAFAASPSVE